MSCKDTPPCCREEIDRLRAELAATKGREHTWFVRARSLMESDRAKDAEIARLKADLDALKAALEKIDKMGVQGNGCVDWTGEQIVRPSAWTIIAREALAKLAERQGAAKGG